MTEDQQDFVTMWERRLLTLAATYVEPAPELSMIEGSAVAVFADESLLTVTVEPEYELAPGAGYWRCGVTVEYGYERTDDAAAVSKMWGQILQAFGNGNDGTDTLTARLRVDPGRLVVPLGHTVVFYDRATTATPDNRIKQFQFTAFLGMQPLRPS